MKKISIIALIALIFDQIIKIIVSSNMYVMESIKIINNFFYLTYTKNIGAAWNIMSGSRYILIIISLVVLVTLYKYLKKIEKFNKIEIISFGLIIGGIIGNLVDRIIYGYVIDYLDFFIFNYDFPIFNIADSCIVIGAILLIINSYKDGRNENRSK